MLLNYAQSDFPETNIAGKCRGASFGDKKETMTEFLRGTTKTKSQFVGLWAFHCLSDDDDYYYYYFRADSYYIYLYKE